MITEVNLDQLPVPRECFSIASNWVMPTESQMIDFFDLNNFSNSWIGRLIGNSRKNTSRWVTGEKTIPYAAWAIICYEAGIKEIWNDDITMFNITRVNVSELELPNECFVIAEKWQCPTREELLAFLKASNLDIAKIAKLVGVSRKTTANLWGIGKKKIPYAAWAIICHEAGIREIWKNKDND